MFRLDVAQRYLAHLIAGVLISVAFVIVNLLVDVIYTIIDPRVHR